MAPRRQNSTALQRPYARAQRPDEPEPLPDASKLEPRRWHVQPDPGVGGTDPETPAAGGTKVVPLCRMSSDMPPEPATAQPPSAVPSPAAADPVAAMVSGALSSVMSGSAPPPDPAPVTEAAAEVRARRTTAFGQFAVPSVPMTSEEPLGVEIPRPFADPETRFISHFSSNTARGVRKTLPRDSRGRGGRPGRARPLARNAPAAANSPVSGGPEVTPDAARSRGAARRTRPRPRTPPVAPPRDPRTPSRHSSAERSRRLRRTPPPPPPPKRRHRGPAARASPPPPRPWSRRRRTRRRGREEGGDEGGGAGPAAGSRLRGDGAATAQEEDPSPRWSAARCAKRPPRWSVRPGRAGAAGVARVAGADVPLGRQEAEREEVVQEGGNLRAHLRHEQGQGRKGGRGEGAGEGEVHGVVRAVEGWVREPGGERRGEPRGAFVPGG